VLIHNIIASHAIGRLDILLRALRVLRRKIGEHRNGDAGRAPFPQVHEPDRIKAVDDKGIPFLIAATVARVTGFRCVRLNSLSETQVLIS
jgi:hypothetical protein